FKEAEFDVIYGQGISRDGELIDLAVKLDIIQKSGAWFSYKEDRLGQGRDNTKEYLRNHPELFAEIEAQVREGLPRLNPQRNLAAPAPQPVEIRLKRRRKYRHLQQKRRSILLLMMNKKEKRRLCRLFLAW
ncbi:MAG: hypothetical protein J6L00_02405, partial [Clostridia bacterium]|nr:hypothetical protein [Clostridia bacterium]